MAYEFPSNPTVGDSYSIFTWNGSGWVRTSTPTTPVSSEFTFQSTTYGAIYNYRDDATPGPGAFSLQASQEAATFVILNAETANGTDLTNAWLASALRGNTIYIQDRDDASNYAVYNVDQAAALVGGYVEIPVSGVARYGTFGNNQECVLMTRTNVVGLIRAGDDIRQLSAPTGADGEPADYNIVVLDKSTGTIKTIPSIDVIEVE